MVTNFKKINRSSLVQVVIDRLTEAMIAGDLKPGDKIPTEMEMAEQMGIARNTIREGIKILTYMGVLEIRRPDGTFVSDGFSEQLIDPMIYGIILNQNNEEELQELRAMIEAGVLNIAVQKCTEEEVDRLREKLAKLKEAIFDPKQNVDLVFERDNDFHAAITEMGKNTMISKINAMAMVFTHSIRYNSVKHMIEKGRKQELYEAHEKVFEMVKERRTSDLYKSIQGTYFVDE